MTSISVDIGNSRIKWFDGKHYHAVEYRPDNFISVIEQHWQDYASVDRVIISDVSSVGALLQGWCDENWQCQCQLIAPQQALGDLTFAYQDGRQLGVDRQLAMLAAWTRWQRDVCVIDAGTAMTIDLVSNEGMHAGGYIVPGYELMLSSLGGGTHALQPDPADVTDLTAGTNTQQCITRGCMAMLVHFCEAVIERYADQQGSKPLTIITGGTAGHLAHWIQQDCLIEPHLVLQGVACWSQLT